MFSNWGAQAKYNPEDKTALWGSYNYTPDKDVLRAPMMVTSIPILDRPVVDRLHGRDRHGRHAGHLVGHDAGVGAVHRAGVIADEVTPS